MGSLRRCLLRPAASALRVFPFRSLPSCTSAGGPDLGSSLRAAAPLRSATLADIAIDDGPEDNAWVQLQHAACLNDHRIIVPAHAFTPVAPSGGRCPIYLSEDTPLIRARYSLSFQANACYGPTAFAPVPYSRWLTSTPGALYVVNTVPPAKEEMLPTAY